MIAAPGILASIARHAEIAVPDDPDDYDPDDYPNFHIFMLVQLGSPMPTPGAAHDNASIVAKLTVAECKTITTSDLIVRGIV